MRTSPRPTAEVADRPCPPDCWMCAAQAGRAPAIPVGVAVLENLLARLRRFRAETADAGPARSWPFSAWWEESLG
ncbi:hypothetical protein [Kineococcus sp. SYSU DK006]|uniref:hypothetical protein n=1 Tax=Kineococcus sp. SYSU DK006 TaxID=3383127 RepID=UPI003D7C7280